MIVSNNLQTLKNNIFIKTYDIVRNKLKDFIVEDGLLKH